MMAVLALSRRSPAEFPVIGFILVPTMDLTHHLA
jgi:hypothetical protein